jgi:tRNA 2-thiouridine synthesizing protein A
LIGIESSKRRGAQERRLDCSAPPAGPQARTCEVSGAVLEIRRRATHARRNVMNFDKELDARGLSCPLPILKTKKSLADIASGQVLKVVATDPGSIKDMQAFANQTGNELLSSSEENKTYVFYVKKK